MTKLAMVIDSYFHYREKVGLGVLLSVYRTLFYEIMGRDPIPK